MKFYLYTLFVFRFAFYLSIILSFFHSFVLFFLLDSAEISNKIIYFPFFFDRVHILRFMDSDKCKTNYYFCFFFSSFSFWKWCTIVIIVSVKKKKRKKGRKKWNKNCVSQIYIYIRYV